jgi:DNA-binding transcriptional regulator YdaS (Cro superfamily)
MDGETTVRMWMRPLKRGVRALCAELGSQRALAGVLGVSDTLVQQWTSRDVEKVIPWPHVLDERVPAAARAMLFRELVGPGIAVVVIPKSAESAGRAADLSLAADTIRQGADVSARLLEAGEFTREKGTAIIRAVDELVGVLLAIRARAERAVSEQAVVGIRRVG